MALSDDPAAYLQLISLAVHELRTPASVVSGYLRMLQRDTDQPLSERQRKMIDEAERSCQRLAALITELSEIQRLDAERLDMQQQTFDLFGLVADVAAGLHEPDDRDVRLEVRGPADGARMRGDTARLQRAFSSVFKAVLREMPDNTIVVGERRLDRSAEGALSAVVVVAAEANLPASSAAPPAPFNEMRGGLGLTLPFARRVIERHGGRLWSPADDRGRGAAIVSLPLAGVPA